jgi:5-carboxymethyl-2-hydroxymuconic-semialdehyde dehydrogenase
MELWREEVFGPVLAWTTFWDEAEALSLANDTDYGLGAVVMGEWEHANRFADRVIAGIVWVNCSMVRRVEQPFGGARNSGIGREGGRWSLDFFAEVKDVCAPAAV